MSELHEPNTKVILSIGIIIAFAKYLILGGDIPR